MGSNQKMQESRYGIWHRSTQWRESSAVKTPLMRSWSSKSTDAKRVIMQENVFFHGIFCCEIMMRWKIFDPRNYPEITLTRASRSNVAADAQLLLMVIKFPNSRKKWPSEVTIHTTTQTLHRNTQQRVQGIHPSTGVLNCGWKRRSGGSWRIQKSFIASN